MSVLEEYSLTFNQHDTHSQTSTLDLTFSENLELNVCSKHHDNGTDKGLDIHLQDSLYLEGIGLFVQKLKPENVGKVTSQTLYYLLCCSASVSILVRQSAAFCLQSIVSSLKLQNGWDLVLLDPERLVENFSVKFHHPYRYPEAPVTFQALLKHTEGDFLQTIEPLTLELLQALDQHYEEQLSHFLPALLTLAEAMNRCYVNNKLQCTSVKKTDDEAEKQSVCDYIQQYHTQKLAAEDFGSDSDSQHGDVTGEDFTKHKIDEPDVLEKDPYSLMNEEKPKPPLYVTLYAQMTERCSHLLMSSNDFLKHHTLNLLSSCLLGLRQQEDTLLPLIHKCWPSFTNRLLEERLPIRHQAYTVLFLIADVAGDFIRKRVMTGVLPVMCEYLKTQARHSAAASASLYSHTAQHRLQVLLLSGLSILASQCDLPSRSLRSMCEVAALYLATSQPPSLQQASVKCLNCLYQLEADTVWLSLMKVHVSGPNTLKPSTPLFPDIHMKKLKKSELVDFSKSDCVMDFLQRIDIPT